MPKGAVADHWTNRGGIGEPHDWHVTGFHYPPKRGKQPEPDPEPVVSRGLVTTSNRRATSAKERQGQLL